MGDDPADLFCAGLPLVGSRALTAAERAVLRARFRALRLHAILGASPTVAFAAFFQAIVARPYLPPSGPERAVIVGCMVLGPVLAIAGATLSAFALSRLLFLYADLRDGRVLRFKGSITGAADALTRAQLVTRGGTHVLEIAAGSGRVHSVDHEAPRAHVVLDLTSLAPPDTTRALGEEEARELRRHARKFVMTTLLDAVLVVLLMAAFAAVVTLHASTRVRAPVGVAVFAAAALVFRRLLVAGRLAFAVRADAKERTVVVLRSEGLELLARSKLAWTREGAKAAWRRA